MQKIYFENQFSLCLGTSLSLLEEIVFADKANTLQDLVPLFLYLIQQQFL